MIHDDAPRPALTSLLDQLDAKTVSQKDGGVSVVPPGFYRFFLRIPALQCRAIIEGSFGTELRAETAILALLGFGAIDRLVLLEPCGVRRHDAAFFDATCRVESK